MKPCHLFAGALLAVAGTSHAATDVQVYGILDAYAGVSANSGAPRTTVVGSGGMTTSFWGLKGSEDLGGALRAVFALESFLRTDTGESGRFNGDPLFARNAFVGLASSLGEVHFGRQSQPLFLTAIAFNPYGSSTRLSPLQVQLFIAPYGLNVAGDTGWSNTVSYTSPAVHGVTVRAMVGLAETEANARNQGLSATWTRGPLSMALVAQRVWSGPGLSPASPAQSTWLAAASYQLPAAKLFATYDRVRADVSGRSSATSQLGASINAGAGSVLLSWAHTSQGGPAAARRDTAAAGYDATLSPRTDLYAVFLYDKLSTAASGNSLALGLRERF